MKQKIKGFTMIELLVVVVILAILVTFVVINVTRYVKKGKIEYNDGINDQLVLAGKNYYGDYDDKLPLYDGEIKAVKLSELQSLGLVSKDFVDANKKDCSDSFVSVEKINGTYKFYGCLICGGEKLYKDKEYADKCNIVEKAPDETKYICRIVNNTYYNKNGNVVSRSNYIKSCGCETFTDAAGGIVYYDSSANIIDSKLNYIKSCGCEVIGNKYYDNEGNKVSTLNDHNDSCKCQHIGDRHYNTAGVYVTNATEHKNDCACEIITDSKGKSYYYDFNAVSTTAEQRRSSCKCQKINNRYYDRDSRSVSSSVYDKQCVFDKPTLLCNSENGEVTLEGIDKNTYSYWIDSVPSYAGKSVSSIPSSLNNTISNPKSDTTYYGHMFRKTSSSNKGSAPAITYGNWSGIAAGIGNYVSSSRTKTAATSSSLFNINKAIPGDYSFALGNTFTSTSVSGATSFSSSDKSSWKGKSMYDDVKQDHVSKPNTTFKIRYSNVGSYNGTKIDVVLQYVGYGKKSSCSAKPFIAFYDTFNSSKYLGIAVGCMDWVKVRYNFYKAGTSTSVKVKGYTTYWDIDCYQGVHMLGGAKGLFATGNTIVKANNINSAPYVYAQTTNNYSSYSYDSRVAFTEIFEASTFDIVYTFKSTKSGSNSSGGIYNSAKVTSAMKTYNGSVGNESTIVVPDNVISYKILYKNSANSNQSVTITDYLDKGLSYVSGSSNLGNPSQTKQSNGTTKLVWSTSVGAQTQGTLTYNAKVTSDANFSVKNNAATKIGSTTYYTSQLENRVIDEKGLSCTYK